MDSIAPKPRHKQSTQLIADIDSPGKEEYFSVTRTVFLSEVEMKNAIEIYRRLQEHLDEHPVGFPKTRSNADIRFLQRMFTLDEAEVALHLTYKPALTATITKNLEGKFFPDITERLLESMFQKGSIAWIKKDGKDHWYSVSVVLGIYEYQGGKPSREFARDSGAYMSTLAYGINFLSVKPSQMRTVPINKSVKVEHAVAPYDDIRAIMQNSEGPFIILPCVCREVKNLVKKPCEKTHRLETCLGFGKMGEMMVRRKHGREISREEAMAILSRSEEEGLVLQPTNAKNPEFVCSCCSCCCGMLAFQKQLPRPVDFWTSNYQVVADTALCNGCGKCVKRCQVNAVTLNGNGKKSLVKVNLNRCIGCGLCTSTCAKHALKLKKKDNAPEIPENPEKLVETILANKRGFIGKAGMVLKIALGRQQ